MFASCLTHLLSSIFLGYVVILRNDGIINLDQIRGEKFTFFYGKYTFSCFFIKNYGINSPIIEAKINVYNKHTRKYFFIFI